MDDQIKEHLKKLNKYYLLLLESRKIPFTGFTESPLYQKSTERFLQSAIESCINIGNRLISLYQFMKLVATPDTHADVF